MTHIAKIEREVSEAEVKRASEAQGLEFVGCKGQAKVVRVRISTPPAEGGRRGWVKHVVSVDESRVDGYAFRGRHLPDGLYELPVGAVLVVYGRGYVGVVQGDGAVEWVKAGNWRTEFLLIRDAVSEALEC